VIPAAGAKKETHVDNQQLAIFGMMAATNTLCGPRDGDGRRRELTVDELDALADFPWPWSGLKGAIVACANVVRSVWRPRASNSVAPLRVPSPSSPSMSARPTAGAN
jgi:hypothetical protein